MDAAISWSDVPKALREQAKPAREAVKLGKSVLLVGPPGAGKTMIARRLVLDLCIKQWVESRAAAEHSAIMRLAGMQQVGPLHLPPFRNPHHTVSVLGMRGSGKDMRPGELSLAHGGVLFLDEAPEFQRRVLEAVASAHRDGCVSYGGESPWLLGLPAKFVLVSAANPCPCGWYGYENPTRQCTCTPEQMSRYGARTLVLPRDVVIKLSPVSFEEMKEF